MQALLVVVDLVAGRLTHDPSRTNLTGTLALAPALTAVGGTRRNVSLVGLVGVVLGVLLSWLDDVPAGAGAIRTTVVVLGTVIALAAADTRMRSMHQPARPPGHRTHPAGRDADRACRSPTTSACAAAT
nr:hypothetical protein [Angustibacter aerolatus]